MNSGPQGVCAGDSALQALAGLLGRQRQGLDLQSEIVYQIRQLLFHEAVGEALK